MISDQQRSSQPTNSIAARLVSIVPPVIWVFFLYLVFSVLLFGQTWLSAGDHIVYGEADVQEVTWFMGWTPFAVSHAHNPFFTTYLDYPSGVNLMWNTAMNVPAILLWPVTATFGPLVATTAGITLALAVSALSVYLLMRRFVRSRLAAVAAGLLYGFNPFMVSQSAGHIHVTIAVFPPLVLLLLHEMLVRQQWPSWQVGAVLGLATAAQLLTGEEVFALTIIVATVGVAVLVAINWRLVPARFPYVARATLVAAAVFLPLAAYPLWMQLFGPQRVAGILPDPYWTDLYALLVPTRWQSLQFLQSTAAHFTSRNLVEEGGAYVGVPLILICAWVTLRLWAIKIVRVASILAVAATLLAMGDRLHRDGRATRWPLPWLVAEHWSVLQNVAPPRLMLFAFLGIAILLGVFVDWALSRGTRAPRVAGLAATLLALVALFPAVPYPTAQAVVPAFFRNASDLQRIPDGSVVLVAPFSRHFTAEAMMWQSVTSMGFRMPEGYAYRPGPTRDPPESALHTRLADIYYSVDRPPLTPELLSAMRADLARMGARTVIVGPEPNHDEAVDLFRQLLGREPEVRDGVAVWWNVSGSAP